VLALALVIVGRSGAFENVVHDGQCFGSRCLIRDAEPKDDLTQLRLVESVEIFVERRHGDDIFGKDTIRCL
jgi:hypothetical protein